MKISEVDEAVFDEGIRRFIVALCFAVEFHGSGVACRCRIFILHGDTLPLALFFFV